jgi:hypothetical protein
MLQWYLSGKKTNFFTKRYADAQNAPKTPAMLSFYLQTPKRIVLISLHPNRRFKKAADHRLFTHAGRRRHACCVLQEAHRIPARYRRREYHPRRAHASLRGSTGVQTRIKGPLYRIRHVNILPRSLDDISGAKLQEASPRSSSVVGGLVDHRTACGVDHDGGGSWSSRGGSIRLDSRKQRKVSSNSNLSDKENIPRLLLSRQCTSNPSSNPTTDDECHEHEDDCRNEPERPPPRHRLLLV